MCLARAVKPETRAVATFFLLTHAITWGLQLPPVLMKEGILPGDHESFMVLVVLGIFGPAVAAYLLVRKTPSDKALLLRSLWSRSPGVLWMLAALSLSGILLSGGLFVASFFEPVGQLAYPIPLARIVPALLISVSEEIGWRGFALPRLSKTMGRLRASLVIGAVWTFWHIPMFLGQGVSPSLWPVMLVQLCAGSVVFTWFYFRTGGSLLIAVLLHLGVHLNNSHLALPGDTTPVYVHTWAWLLLALTFSFFGRRVFAGSKTS